jgi:hypothetical protein
MRGVAPALLLVVAFLSAAAAAAHPGVGIVRDSHGNIYYTDLKQVWRIAPDGAKSVAVPGVHTHELALDAQDNLYGEHLWYEGDRTKKWGHYVWRRSPEGRIEKILGPREGFLRDFSFVRDAAGNIYWVERPSSPEAATPIRKRAPDGSNIEVARGHFKNVRWMAAAADGTVYLVDARGGWEHNLVRITSAGKIAVVVKQLAEDRLLRFTIAEQHAVMGLAAAVDGSVYVAVASERVVKKVSPAGQVSIVARGNAVWYATGVLPLPNGDLWLLETNAVNSVRARLLRPDGTSSTF